MSREEIIQEYRRRYEAYAAEEALAGRRIRQYSMFRILFFLAWMVLVFLSTGWSWTVFGIILGGGILIFAFLIRKHSALHNRKAKLERYVQINSENINTMHWDVEGQDGGAEFADAGHLFSRDLDLFGDGSIFQYINRTSTFPGKEYLHHLLTRLERSNKKILQRQEAVAELAPLLDWRQDFRVQGLLFDEDKEDITGLKKWIDSSPDFRHTVFKAMVVVIPLVTFLLLALTIAGLVSFWHFLAYLIIPLAISGIKYRKVNVKHHLLSRKFTVLKKYSSLFRLMEHEGFASSRMVELQGGLMRGKESASVAIRRLARIANAFDTRLNLLAGLIMNIFFLWDMRQSIRLENWQLTYRDHLEDWYDVLAETDAFISLAGFAWNNPDYVFPELMEDKGFELETKLMGHPLIHVEKRVCNDYSVKGWGRFTILTGANMAGKSTFLRTIGVNMVLACAGAPVCARSFRFTPAGLVTSIQTFDSLAHNESYFYAELKRLKRIIELLKQGDQIFIILDEILKGTNSSDKQLGSNALIRQLISLGASGIIATHDLSLGELEQEFPGHVQNSCFEVIIENDRLEYDYRLKKGTASNMNATILMERMGITLGSA